MLLQMIWSCGLDWDEQLDSSLLNEARKLFADLTELSSVRIPRCLRVPDELSVMSVHVFADASADAYASVVYTKCEYVLGHISCHFVCAKTKLASFYQLQIQWTIAKFIYPISLLQIYNGQIQNISKLFQIASHTWPKLFETIDFLQLQCHVTPSTTELSVESLLRRVVTRSRMPKIFDSF